MIYWGKNDRGGTVCKLKHYLLQTIEDSVKLYSIQNPLKKVDIDSKLLKTIKYPLKNGKSKNDDFGNLFGRSLLKYLFCKEKPHFLPMVINDWGWNSTSCYWHLFFVFYFSLFSFDLYSWHFGEISLVG